MVLQAQAEGGEQISQCKINLPKIRAAMSSRGFDAVYLTSEANRFYASGFRSSDGFVYISSRSACFATDFRYFEDAGRHIEGYELFMLGSSLRPCDLLAELIKRDSAVSVAFEEDFVTCSEYEKIRPLASFVPLNGMMSSLRLVKEPFEVMRIAMAQRIAEKSYSMLLERIKPGISELDVKAELEYLMLKNGSEGAAFDTICVSGENSSLCHGCAGGRKLQNGDFLTLDFGCTYMGYRSDMTRTVAVGFADDEMRKVYNTVLEAQNAALCAAKAGMTGAALHHVAADVISRAGYGEYFGHGLGHSVGICVHDGAGASPSNPNPLPAGAVISIEPGIYIPRKFGVRIEDIVCIEHGGIRNLTNCPKELIIV